MSSDKKDKPSQSEKFSSFARSIEAEENEERFDEVMRELAKKPPAPREKTKSDKK